MNTLKTAIGNLADRLGLVVPKWRSDIYPAACYMQKLFDLLEIDLVVDVGANEGQYHDFLREQVGYRGRVVSFEPLPQIASTLRARAKNDGTWTVEDRALGREAGTANFNVMRDSKLSSFLAPDHARIGNLLVKYNAIESTIPVSVSTLDAELPGILSSYGGRNIFLKMDTQGFDLEVLKGASASLPGIAALQTEISFTPIYASMPPYHEVIQYLEDCGFAMSGIYPISGLLFPRQLEFDGYMINRTRIP